MNSFRYHSTLLTGDIIIDVRGVRASLKNRGTIVVLNRYASALCFLEVFEWWYYRGTKVVRMRYAHKLDHFGYEYLVHCFSAMSTTLHVLS